MLIGLAKIAHDDDPDLYGEEYPIDERMDLGSDDIETTDIEPKKKKKIFSGLNKINMTKKEG